MSTLSTFVPLISEGPRPEISMDLNNYDQAIHDPILKTKIQRALSATSGLWSVEITHVEFSKTRMLANVKYNSVLTTTCFQKIKTVTLLALMVLSAGILALLMLIPSVKNTYHRGTLGDHVKEKFDTFVIKTNTPA